MVTQVVFSQKTTVTGLVSDANGPLPGVTIIVKGTTRGVETDFDGNYSITVSKGKTLVYSFIGMKTVERVIGDIDVINLILEDELDLLDEIEVVATGFDNIKKEAFTGSAATIKAEDLKIDGIIDVGRLLEGRVSGLSVQNVSGTFGSAPRITIRGSSSIFGNNTPLYVVDGVVQEDIIEQNLDQLTSGNSSGLISSSIAGISANDIEKIDILKDASATSLYGARARNGVIVITTKSGRKESPLKISYNLENTLREIPNYNDFDILDSKESLTIIKELESKGHLQITNSLQNRSGGIYSIMYDRINTFDPNTGRFLLANTPEARNQFLRQYETANTDWFKELFQYNIMQNHSLSLTGGGEKNTYYASISFLNDPGRTLADNVKRVTGNIKNTFYFSDKFNATLSLVTSIRDQQAPGTFNSQRDGFNGEITRDFDINPFSYVLNTSRTLRPRDNQGNLEYYRNNWARFNILEELENNFIDLKLRDIRLQLDANYKISDNITYDFNGAARYVSSSNEHKVQEQSNVVAAYNADDTRIVRDANIFLYNDPNDPNDVPVAVLPKGGIYTKNTNDLTSFYIRNSIKYSNTFGDNHNLDVLLGQDLRYVDRDADNFVGYGLQFENGLIPFTDPRILEKVISEGNDYFGLDKQRERTIAAFGSITYDYDNRYIFSASGRYDGSNRQGNVSSSRFLPTGTLSAKWNASNEDFLSSSETISKLGFRASYGLVATPGSATNSLSIIRSQVSNRFSPFDRETLLNITALQNSQLTWEKQIETNVGFDLGLFRNRINISSDFYIRDIFDNIDFIRTSGIGGQITKLGNNADVRTKGFEFSLDTKNINSENFKWSTNLTFSYFDQEITNLISRPNVLDAVDQTGTSIEGFPINALFSFEFAGLSDRGIPQFINKDGEVSQVVDFQENENITDYLRYEGSVNPNISGGFANRFKYKNWDLNVLITGSGGNKIRLDNAYRANYTDLDVFTKDFQNRWLIPGDENITNIPKIPTLSEITRIPRLDRAYNAYNFSSVRVADGDFLRMKNISLGYSFNKELIDKLGLANLKVKLQGTNLFLIYSDDRLNGQDPEFFQSGGVALPITRQYTFSLNLGF